MIAKPLMLALCLATIAATAAASDQAASPFFTAEQLRRIGAAAPPALGAPSPDLIHLGAVLYYGPDNWALWLQGERWTPETDRPDLHILAVTPEQVRLSLTPLDDGPALDITLRPHQSYNRVTQTISEGRL